MIYFKIENIKVNQFAIIEPSSETKDIQISGNITTSFNSEEYLINIILSSKYMIKEKQLLTFQVTCAFKIKDETWQEWSKQNQVVIPRDFLVHLAVLTFGTARGILYERTSGTIYQTLYLPLTNVDEFFKEDIVINK